MTGKSDSTKKGFSGLSDLVSDIGDIQALGAAESGVTEAPSSAVGATSVQKGRSSASGVQIRATPVQGVETFGSAKSEGGSLGKWIRGTLGGIFIAGLFLIGLAIVVSESENGSPPGSTPRAQQSTTASTQDLQYAIPAIGSNNTLTVAEIRWCVREGIRIDTMQPLIDTSGGIDEFNRIVAAYNPRCGNFRYYEGDLERAEREVETDRWRIVEAAIDEATLLDRKYQVAKPSVAEPPRNYQILEFEFKKDPTQEWQSLHDRAESLVKQGKLEEAATVGEQALHLWDGERENAHVASSLDFLAVLYSRLGRNADAEPILERSLQLYRRLYGPNDARVIRTMKNKARLYRIMGHESEAVLLEKQVRELEGR